MMFAADGKAGPGSLQLVMFTLMLGMVLANPNCCSHGLSLCGLRFACHSVDVLASS